MTRFVDLVLTWHERARQRRALLRLDDRMLSDIGVGRGTAQDGGTKAFLAAVIGDGWVHAPTEPGLGYAIGWDRLKREHTATLA